MTVQAFTFNPFAENTYVIYDETGECAIVDPGCFDHNEEQQLSDFITRQHLTPVRLINTHCHLDHIFGVDFVKWTYGLDFEIPEGEEVVLAFAQQSGLMFGTPLSRAPVAEKLIHEGDRIHFGNTTLDVLLTPGHSPASVCFLDKAGKQLISGDVLFKDSIGRTDLPGGDYETLMQSIFSKLMDLDDEVVVYPGHMDSTTIGAERKRNPFLHEYLLRR